MEEFLSYLNSISPLSEESSSAFMSKCKNFTFPKGHLAVRIGQVAQYLYYVKSGLGKVYYLKEGAEIIDWIGDERNLLTSVVSFLTHQASAHNVELLEKSELIGISYNQLEALFQQHHDIERLERKLTTMALVQIQERVNSMQFESAEKRYHNFLEKFPNCINRISLGDVASYLGMTQVTLSRIRRQV